MEPANSYVTPELARDLPTSRRRFAALLALTHGLTDAPGLPEAARKVLAALGDAEGWSAGILWLAPGYDGGRPPMPPGPAGYDGGRPPMSPGPAGYDGGRPPQTTGHDCLHCLEVWSAPDRPAPDLERFAREASILRGESLAGRAWATGRAVFVGDLARDDDLRREPRLEGFRAAAAVPIPYGPPYESSSPRPPPASRPAVASRLGPASRPAVVIAAGLPAAPAPALVGVIELFARGTREPDLVSDDLWSVIAVELGRLARRAAAERALARTEERLHTLEEALRRSDAQLIEADRLASLGTLAAGVAHEINNPLSYVLLNLDLVIREVSHVSSQAAGAASAGAVLSAEVLERLRDARSGIERVRLIVQDLKSFSRADTERREPVDVRRVLDTTIEIAANEIRHRARLLRQYREVPAVEADASRLGQVFLNLLVNAAQAMTEGDASRHEIRVATATNAAGGVVVTIADTGAGVAPENLERIFDPFFTTKPAGVGTGLGLSICRGIVKALGGEITVESELGRGTTFRVTLPAAAAPALAPDDPAPPPVSSPLSVPTSHRGGRILVIDDEPALASALARSIERDYEVVVIASGREALERLRRDDAFDVILCDLIMPQVTGMDLYDELHRTSPGLADRIIFMTGGSFTTRAREFLAKVSNPALDKPFDLSALSAMLRARTRR